MHRQRTLCETARGNVSPGPYLGDVLYEMQVYVQRKRGIGGVSFFGWAGEGRPAAPHAGVAPGWHEGDPFVGDPPSERQGRFSVFNTDVSTCGLIQDYAAKLNTPWVDLA